MSVISWNIERAKRSAFSLAHFTSLHSPALVFLSEPQLFQCDTTLALAPLTDYRHHLNSEDMLLPTLALDQRKAWGGTMAMWHSSLDPFITVLPTPSPAVLPILLAIPGLSSSLHVGLYLPTSGCEQEFLLALTAMDSVLTSLAEDHSGVPIYLRGDCNVNPNNTKRLQIFNHVLTKHSITSLNLQHLTHHHFTGNGASRLPIGCSNVQGNP